MAQGLKTQFIATFLGVLMASLTVAFFSVMWHKSSRVDDVERQLELLRTVDNTLLSELAILKASSDSQIGPKTKELAHSESVEKAREAIQKRVDKDLYRQRQQTE